MTKTNDKLLRELEVFDPVRPGELEGARERGAELLQRMLVEPTAGPEDLDDARPYGSLLRGIPVLVALTAVAIALAVLLVGLPGGDRKVDDELTVALDKAAAAAAVRSMTVVAQPYTYLETRELATETKRLGGRSWSVDRRSTRQEWVGWDGSGRLRLVAAPERFAGAADRGEWEAAGSPRPFGLGAERRIEDRWIETGLLDSGVEELPTEPVALAARLREEARAEPGGLPVPAAILKRIAADLRSPAASPGLRGSLYRAAGLTPGIEYLGGATDPEGRHGVAVGLTGAFRGVPARYSLIFDPRTARVLATETTAIGAGAGTPPLRATVYLDSRGVGSPAPHADTWLSDYDPSAIERHPTSPFLVYRIPERNPWARTVGDG